MRQLAGERRHRHHHEHQVEEQLEPGRFTTVLMGHGWELGAVCHGFTQTFAGSSP